MVWAFMGPVLPETQPFQAAKLLLVSLLSCFRSGGRYSSAVWRHGDPRRTMAGLKDKRGFIDKDRLDLSERQAVEYWMKRWGVTRDQITAAHRKAGRMVKDIAAELGKKR